MWFFDVSPAVSGGNDPMVLHWWKILCYTKSSDCATLKAEMVQYLGSRLPNDATRKAEMMQYLGSRLRRELALQGNKLQAVDIEQTDVTPFNDNEPFFDKLGEGANGIGSAHVAECSQFATCKMRQHI